MTSEPVPLNILRTIRAHYPRANHKEIQKLWDCAPGVVAEWARYDYAADENMDAARLFYVLYALTPQNKSINRRKRDGWRVAALMVLLPRWNVAAAY